MISLNLIPPLLIKGEGRERGVCVYVCKREREGEKEQGKKEECRVTELITALAGGSAACAAILSCPSRPALANTATHSYCN